MRQNLITPDNTRTIAWIGSGLVVASLAGWWVAAWLLDRIFVPLGNYLHPEWDAPDSALLPSQLLLSVLAALFITGMLAWVFLGAMHVYRRRRKVI